MIALIAESKTMLSQQQPVSENDFINHRPILEESADEIMAGMSQLSPSEISSILGISNALAVKAHNLAYDFPHKLMGYKAIDAFIGDAYRGLDISTIPASILATADSKLKIISSVYGLLNPSDIIKPYRCEFSKPIAPGHKTPIEFFKAKVTVQLVNYIKENKVNDIIDLLPGDADKCIDWKIVRAFAAVHKVVFQTIDSNGKLKTPIAKRLKELRGIMTRTIMVKNIQSFKELTAIESNHFLFSPQDSKPGLPVFITSAE